jgi:TrmH RNA methyltransferase
VYGYRAGVAVLERRLAEVRAVHYGPEVRGPIQEILERARRAGVLVQPATPEALLRLAGSKHHEELCVETSARRFASPSQLAESLARTRGAAIALDRVRNPYNVGALLRTAAFFGVEAALLGAPAPHPALHPDAVRVAEGGAEHLLLSRTTDLADTLQRLRKLGVSVVGAESGTGPSVFEYAFSGPAVLVVGHEREGLGERVRAECDTLVQIPGAGGVDSLNVGVAGGIAIAELARGIQRGRPAASAR